MVLGFSTTNKKTREATNFVDLILDGRKIHSIREGDRWKESMAIQMATGVRTKSQQVFNADRDDLSTCKGVQSIEINTKGGEFRGIEYTITIDGRKLSEREAKQLATNDGFSSLYEFLTWFQTGKITGQIIHWTDLKYL